MFFMALDCPSYRTRPLEKDRTFPRVGKKSQIFSNPWKPNHFGVKTFSNPADERRSSQIRNYLYPNIGKFVSHERAHRSQKTSKYRNNEIGTKRERIDHKKLPNIGITKLEQKQKVSLAETQRERSVWVV